MTTAYPKIVYEKTRVQNGHRVGRAIAVMAATFNRCQVLSTAQISPQNAQFIELGSAIRRPFSRHGCRPRRGAPEKPAPSSRCSGVAVPSE